MSECDCANCQWLKTPKGMASVSNLRIAYIAGPYRAATEWEIDANIRLARKAAARAWRSGYAVICPHSNTAFMGGVVPDERILEGDLAMLSRCEVIILLPGWHRSAGARNELALAQRMELMVCDYDEGRDRIVMRRRTAAASCSYCGQAPGDPTKTWIMPDDTVMCGPCAERRREPVDVVV